MGSSVLCSGSRGLLLDRNNKMKLITIIESRRSNFIINNFVVFFFEVVSVSIIVSQVEAH